jgi:hypothetical protein
MDFIDNSPLGWLSYRLREVARMFPKLAKTFAIRGSVTARVETTTGFGTLAEPGFGDV